MNELYVISTSVILVFLILRQLQVWRWRCLISPGFYFGVLWILGVIGVYLFAELEIFPVSFPEYLDELNIYVGFTGLCFIYFTPKGRNMVLNEGINFTFLPNFRLYFCLSSFLLIVALSTFISSGADFNMGAARERMHETLENQSVIVGYAQSLSAVLSICAGYVFGNLFNGKVRLSLFRKAVYLFPIVSGLLFSIYLGGRVNLVYAIVEYIIGFSLAIPIMPKKKINRKIFIYVFSSLFIVSSFISLVAAQRQKHQGGASYQYNLVSEISPIMFLAYGPMEYMVASYLGYQYRRDDMVDLTNLGYGSYTFNGFINWTIPFAARFGLEDVSIAKTFDIYHDAQASYDYKRMYYYTTHSCYTPIVQDFGKIGALFLIIFLTYISHMLFVSIQKCRTVKYATRLFLFYLFLFYWVKSNYYGYFMNSVLVVLYGFLIIDILKIVKTRPR